MVESLAMAGYSLLLLTALVLAAPWWLGRMFFSGTEGRYREGLGERLGRVPAGLRTAVYGRRVVWVHAVSVGEVLAATRLVEELERALVAEFGEGWSIVVSTTTATGQALARERFAGSRGAGVVGSMNTAAGAAHAGGTNAAGTNATPVFYYPLDFAWAVRAYLRALKPELVVLMESEIWPRMLVECGRRGIPVAVVNARVSDRSYARGLRLKPIWGWVLRRVSLFLAQSEEDGKRLLEMGARSSSVKAIGNLKFDVRAPNASRVAGLILDAAAGRPIVVAGSTVGGLKERDASEDHWLTTIWQGMEVDALLVLAPRHRERFQAVWKDAADEFATVRATELLAEKEGTQFSYQVREPGDRRPEIVILDTIGDLAAVYSVASVAFVGGSLIKRGGHNPLEPAQFGVPILMGPSFENFRDIVAKMRAANAICITAGEAQLPNEMLADNRLYRPEIYEMRDSLEAELMRLLTNRDAAKAMGERGRAVFEAQSGATGRAVEALLGLVRDRHQGEGPGGGLKGTADGLVRTRDRVRP